jgi:hypothetical protein
MAINENKGNLLIVFLPVSGRITHDRCRNQIKEALAPPGLGVGDRLTISLVKQHKKPKYGYWRGREEMGTYHEGGQGS